MEPTRKSPACAPQSQPPVDGFPGVVGTFGAEPRRRNSIRQRIARGLGSKAALRLACALVFCAAPAMAQPGVPYETVIEGIEDHALLQALESVSATRDLQERPPLTLSLLRRRAEKDIPVFRKVLQSRGYYGADIGVSIDDTAAPLRVVFHVDPGPLYRVSQADIRVAGPGASIADRLPSLESLGLPVGAPAESRPILDAGEALLEEMARRGYPLARIQERRVVVDHRTREVRVSYAFESGPLCRFGPTTVEGLSTVDESVVRRKIPWQEGQVFNQDLVATARNQLIELELFSLVRIEHADEPEADGHLPMTVEVVERKQRTVRAGLSYLTDEGAGIRTSWENRNLFGRGDRVAFQGEVSDIYLALDGSFRKREFLREDQSLLLSERLAEEDTDAFTSRNITTGAMAERDLGAGMRFSTGLALRISEVDDVMSEDEFIFLSLLSRFTRDTVDNPLDATRGGRLQFSVAPFADVLDQESHFLKVYGSYSHFLQLRETPRAVFALRAAVGTLWGTGRNSVPADLRYYAGGGGSIRGYAFQSVGPLSDDDPLGGRSLLELSNELRMNVTETLGFAVFLDGGAAFESAYPDLEESVRWGTGLGLRYFTPIGPFRIDVAFPLNRRDDVDDSYQVYISLGQAF